MQFSWRSSFSGRWLAAALSGAAASMAGFAAPAPAADSAVVVMYHRFGESAQPSTNIAIQQFEAHLAELKSGEYNVLRLADIVDSLKHGRPLPDRAVGLSIDDAYLSVYQEAWPRLKTAGFPFTLFVATSPIDRGLAGHMSWDQLRALAAAGVTIGSQTASHLHMADAEVERNRREVVKSNARFEAELGRRPTLFAYPYGEASLAVEKLARQAGFAAAFGQHSGVISAADDFYYLPRFAMNETYGDVSRFRLVANALALPVTDFTPADPLIRGNNPPAIGFTVMAGIPRLNRLSCYVSHEGRTRLERLGDTRFEVRLRNAFPKGRSRLNCTLPTPGGRWRWLGRQFYIAP